MITALHPGMPVSDLDARRFFGCEPDLRVADAILWGIGANGCLSVARAPERIAANKLVGSWNALGAAQGFAFAAEMAGFRA